jgi:hypothetical protein
MAQLGASVAVALGALALTTGVTWSNDAPPLRVVHYERDALTVHVAGVPVGEVLEEIGRQAGADIQGGVRTPHDVSAEFDAVPLPEALHRLLGDQNFALVYGGGGHLRTVKLLGGPQNQPVPVVAAEPPAKPGGMAELLNMVATHAPVPVSGRLAQALGNDKASVQQILDASLHNEDATVRFEAVRRALAVLEAEPALRSTLLSTVNGIQDGEVANLLRGIASSHAVEMVTYISTQARANELRIKASGVLQQLRAQASDGG